MRVIAMATDREYVSFVTGYGLSAGTTLAHFEQTKFKPLGAF